MIVTEAALREQLRRPTVGAVVDVPPGATLTPAARDLVAHWRLELREVAAATPTAPVRSPTAPAAGERSAGQGRPDWDAPSVFPVVFEGDVPGCVTCGAPVTDKPGHLTQLDPRFFAVKTDARIRLRGRLDTLQAWCLLAGSRALALGRADLAGHLDTLAAYCRELVSAEYHLRAPAPLALAGFDADTLHRASHQPREAVGIDHATPGLEHPELLHWCNLLRCEVREVEIAALEAFPPEHHPGTQGGAVAQAVNRLSSGVYYLVLLLAAETAGAGEDVPAAGEVGP